MVVIFRPMPTSDGRLRYSVVQLHYRNESKSQLRARTAYCSQSKDQRLQNPYSRELGFGTFGFWCQPPHQIQPLYLHAPSQAGHDTRTERAKPEELANCETWSLSSLQGIRGVTSWQNIPMGKHKMLNSFRKRLMMLSEGSKGENSVIA